MLHQATWRSHGICLKGSINVIVKNVNLTCFWEHYSAGFVSVFQTYLAKMSIWRVFGSIIRQDLFRFSKRNRQKCQFEVCGEHYNAGGVLRRPCGGGGPPAVCATRHAQELFNIYIVCMCWCIVHIDYTWYEVSRLLNDNSTRYRAENEKK